MHVEICDRRLIYPDVSLPGWAADKQPGYPFLFAIIEELGSIPVPASIDFVAEMGADYTDDDDDALSIVLADDSYFSTSPGNLRAVAAFITADVPNAKYYGMGLDDTDFTIPFANPRAVEIAARKLLGLGLHQSSSGAMTSER